MDSKIGPDLTDQFLGVSAAEPGYSCVRVAPKIDGLSNSDGVVPIPAGDVKVAWKKTAELFELTVVVPIGIHLQVRLPAHPTDALFIDGEPISLDTMTVRTEEYVDLAVLPGSRYVFRVLSDHNNTPI